MKGEIEVRFYRWKLFSACWAYSFMAVTCDGASNAIDLLIVLLGLKIACSEAFQLLFDSTTFSSVRHVLFNCRQVINYCILNSCMNACTVSPQDTTKMRSETLFVIRIRDLNVKMPG